MITKNFRLNALQANKYASALYNHNTSTSGGDYFMVDASVYRPSPLPHRQWSKETFNLIDS